MDINNKLHIKEYNREYYYKRKNNEKYKEYQKKYYRDKHPLKIKGKKTYIEINTKENLIYFE